MGLEKAAVAAIVEDNKGNVLLGKKLKDSEGLLEGKWHIPGETLEGGESDEEGLKRGILEEAGIEIDVLRYIDSHRTPKNTLVRWYECEAKTYDIKAGSDLEKVQWVQKKDVKKRCDYESRKLWPKEIQGYFNV